MNFWNPLHFNIFPPNKIQCLTHRQHVIEDSPACDIHVTFLLTGLGWKNTEKAVRWSPKCKIITPKQL